MNNLRCRKQGFNKYVCKHTNKQINLRDCTNCPYKEYKSNGSNSTKLKKRTSKQAKLERERTSLFTNNLSKCFLCGSEYQVTKHEIFRGRNRPNSMKYGLVLPLCLSCHEKYQEDSSFNDYWHKKAQKEFEKKYSHELFMEAFRKNYLF